MDPVPEQQPEHLPILGTWRLVSFELHSPDGEVSYPFGPEVRGYLIYGADGYMLSAFESADRGKESSGDLADAAANATYDAFMSYCGRYEVQSDKIFHYVEVSSLVVWNGTVQERMYKLEGDRMTLLTAPLLVASEAPTACLVWDRVARDQ